MNNKIEEATKRFFSQFEGIDTDKYYIALFENDRSDGFKMVQYLSNFADENRELDLLFSEDENKGYMALVDKDNEDIIGLMSKYLIGTDFKHFGYDISSLLPAYDGKVVLPKTRRNADDFRDKVLQDGYFENELEIVSFFRNDYQPRMLNITNPLLEYRKRFIANSLRYKEILKGIKWAMKDEGIIDSERWKSEFSLFLLTEEYFDDVIYQYRSDWLGMQSLDIYIPVVKVGIEYQGIQHYEPVERFGGMEHFLDGQARDEKKRKLCRENGVTLIEWPYTEAVEANRFVTVFAEKGVEVQKKRSRDQIKHGKYISDEELLKASSYQKGKGDDNFLKALENLDVARLYEYSKEAIIANKEEQVSKYVNVLAQAHNFKILNNYVRAVIADAGYKDRLMPIIVSNEDFVKQFLDNSLFNYFVTNMIISMIKSGHLNEGIAWIHKLLQKEYDNEKEICNRAKKKRTPMSDEEIRIIKIGRLPKDMWDAGVPHDLIRDVCAEFGLKFTPYDY